MAEGPYVTLTDFKPGGLRSDRPIQASAQAPAPQAFSTELDKAIEELVTQRILVALETCRNNVSQAARQLGISRGRLYDLAKRYKLKLG